VQSSLREEEIYKMLYGGRRFNISTVRNLYFRLNELAKNFLSIREFEKERMLQSDLLLRQLNNREIKQSFLKTLGRAEKAVDAAESFSRDSYYFKYKLANQKLDFAKLSEPIIKKDMAGEHLKYLSDSDLFLTIFYITELICDYLLTQAQSYKHSLALDKNFTDKVLGWINVKNVIEYCDENKREEFLLLLYADLLNAYADFDDYNKYLKYKETFFRCKRRLSQIEISFHYERLINYCNLKRIALCKDYDFDRELFAVYQQAIPDRYWVNDVQKYLPSSLFRAVVFLAVHLNKLRWLDGFIEKNAKLMRPKEKENMYNFGMAYYHFGLQNYEKSRDYANYIKPNYFIFKYDIHNLESRLFYKLGYYDGALTKISSYSKLIKNDEFLEQSRKTNHKNFIRYIKELVEYKNEEREIEDVEFKKRQLQKEDHILYKNWLLQEYDLTLKQAMALKAESI
jgi:hypothetical protein